MRDRSRLQALTVTFLLFHALVWGAPLTALPSAPEADQGSRIARPGCQLITSSHVLGFLDSGMFMAAPDHLLRVEFLGAHRVPPQGRNVCGGDSEPTASPAAASEVVYPDLWDGITVAFERDASGNPKSTYRLQPGVSPERIQLQYNRPARIGPSGDLVLAFPGGEIRESAPVAWQEINGARVPVHAEFRLLGGQRAGFRLHQYHPRYAITIDPAVTWHTFLGSVADDQGRGVALDAQGNVYVVGDGKADWTIPGAIRAYSGSGNSDAFVVKLNASGARVWHTFLGSAANDLGNAIAVDPGGNVFVAGSSEAGWGSPVRAFSGSTDAFVAKLDTNGGILWNTFLGSADNDVSTALALESGGNILVGGASAGTWHAPVTLYSGGLDVFIAMLNSSGGLAWNTFLGGDSDEGLGGSIGLDNSGNIYVAGSSSSTWGFPVSSFAAGISHAFIAKLNSGGARQWHTFLGASTLDIAHGILTDPQGNVFVTGSSSGSWGAPLDAFAGDYDGFVARLDTTGNLVWNTFLGSGYFDNSVAITRDPFTGAIALAGSSAQTWGLPLNAHSLGNRDILAVKLDTDGHRMWNTFLGSSNTEEAYALTFDTAQNLYLTGFSYTEWPSISTPPVSNHTSSVNKDVFVARVPRVSASPIWNTFMGSSDNLDTAYDTAADNSGNVLVVGRSGSSWGFPLQPYGGGPSDGLLAKLNPAGVRQWHTFIGASGTDYANSVVLDSSENIYVAGSSTQTWGVSPGPVDAHSGGQDVFVARYSSSGQLVWSTFMGSSADDDSYSLAIDGSGKLYVAGFSNAAWGGSPINPHSGGMDAFLACIDSSNGQRLWHTFMGSAGGDDYAYGVAVSSGTVYVAGYSNVTWGSPINPFNNSFDAFVTAFNAGTGQRNWLTFMGSTSDDYATSVAVDISGDLVVAGTSRGSWGSSIIRPFSGARDAFAAKLGSNGALKWNTFLGSEVDETGSSVVVGPWGSIFVAGHGAGSWGTPLWPYTNLLDGFLARLDTNGQLVWNLFFGSSGDDSIYSMSIDRSGYLYLPGFSTNSWGNPVYPFVGIRDALVVKLFQDIATLNYFVPIIQKD